MSETVEYFTNKIDDIRSEMVETIHECIADEKEILVPSGALYVNEYEVNKIESDCTVHILPNGEEWPTEFCDMSVETLLNVLEYLVSRG